MSRSAVSCEHFAKAAHLLVVNEVVGQGAGHEPVPFSAF